MPPRDGKALAAALQRLLSDAALREKMGKQGAKTAQRYSWEQVSAQVLEYYQATANGTASAGSEP